MFTSDINQRFYKKKIFQKIEEEKYYFIQNSPLNKCYLEGNGKETHFARKMHQRQHSLLDFRKKYRF